MERAKILAWLVAGVIALGACGAGGTPAVTPTRSARVRVPAVAGMFYPADPRELAAMVDGFLSQWSPTPGRPLALIVPHAGYPYSGRTAAAAYAQLRGQHYEAVVLVGQNHFLGDFAGVDVYAEGAFRTPLGEMPVDTELARAILQTEPAFSDNPSFHAQEHALEVQIPFLQRVLPGTPIVPILIGRPTPQNLERLENALVQVLKGHDVLLVASSDLSHYPSYADAVRVDRAVLEAIVSLDVQRLQETLARQMALGIPNLYTPCCSEGAVIVVLEVARRLGADRAALLDYTNSGDVPGGDRERVVGYGAVKIWKQ
ncbi:MAG: AmmeMemoRadiSam system protein B [Chloroflexia bacterium]